MTCQDSDSVPTPYLLILSHSTPLHSIPFHSIPSHHLRVYFRTFSQLRIQIRPHLILQTMPDTSADHLPESPEQSATKSQLLNLKEKIDKIVREYNEAGIPAIPRKTRKDLRDRLTLTWVPVTAGISSTKWRNERAQDVYRRVLNACPHLYIAFISVIAPTACFQPDLGRIVTELLHLVEETPIRLNLNSEEKEFFRSVAEACAVTEDPWYTKFICSLFPGEPPLPTETPGHDRSLSSVCGSPNTVQTSPKSSPPSLVSGTESFGIGRPATVQCPTVQLAVHTASSVLDNVQDIKALDFRQRAVATFEGAIFFAAESIPGSQEREAWISSCVNQLQLLKQFSVNESNGSGLKRKRKRGADQDGCNGIESAVDPAAVNLQAGNESSLDSSLPQTLVGLAHDQREATGKTGPVDPDFRELSRAQDARQVGSGMKIAILAEVDKLESTVGGYLFKGMNETYMRLREKDGGRMTLTDTVRLHLAYQEGEDFKLEVWLCSSVGKAISEARLRSVEDLRDMLGNYLFEAMEASNWRKEEEERGISECTGAIDVSFPNGEDGSDCKMRVLLNFVMGIRVFERIYPGTI